MNQFILLLVGMVALAIGSVLGYYARQSIARKQAGTLESKLKKRIDQTKQESEKILSEAKEEASQIIEAIKKEEDARRGELIKTERLLLRRESNLDARIQTLDRKENEFRQKVEKLREIKKSLESLRQEALEKVKRQSEVQDPGLAQKILQSLMKDRMNWNDPPKLAKTMKENPQFTREQIIDALHREMHREAMNIQIKQAYPDAKFVMHKGWIVDNKIIVRDPYAK